jgi:hypothetical protein
MIRLPDELQAELNKVEAEAKAAAKAAIDSHYEARKDRKRQELQDIELEHQQALEDLERRLPIESSGGSSPQVLPVPKEAPSHSQENLAIRNGSYGTPTRRAMLLAVLPDLKGGDFVRRDAEAKILEKWPEVEPKTKAEYKSFTSGIAALLADLTDKGRLEATKGQGRFDPTYYRVIENDEGTLLK